MILTKVEKDMIIDLIDNKLINYPKSTFDNSTMDYPNKLLKIKNKLEGKHERQQKNSIA